MRKAQMIVYRFEKKGIGPYIGQAKGVWLRPKPRTRSQKKYYGLLVQELQKKKNDNRSNVYNKSHSQETYLYGCPSKTALRSYFYGNFKSLFKEGYRIKRYRVPDHEVLDMGIEVAFPVKYHKLRTVKNVVEKMEQVRNT